MFNFPDAPTTGQTTVGSNGATYVWDGSKWSARSGSSPIVSDTPPSNPAVGTLWWDSAGGQLYVWFADADSAQWVIANSGNADPTVGASLNNVGRNLLHNPLFNVAQRGAGPWTITNLTADRWTLGITSDTVSGSIVALNDADRAAIGDEAASWAYQVTFTGSAAAGANTQLSQGLEASRRLGSKTVTLSFWAKAAAGTPKLGLSWWQRYGNGGSPSTNGFVSTPATVTLSTTWTRYSATFVMPSLAGKSFGTAGDDAIQPAFAFSSGATYNVPLGSPGVQSGTIQIWGVQLEVGSVATPLEKPDPQQDLAKCQRFYYAATNLTIGGYAVGAGVAQWASMLLPVPMRGTPTVALASIGSGNASLSVNSGTPTCVALLLTASASGAVWASVNLTASADL